VRIANGVVAIAVPAIKIISRRGIGNFVLRVVARAAHHDRLTAPYVRAALGSRDVYVTSANQDFSLIVRVNRDPEAGIAPARMNGKIRSIDFDVRFAIFQYRVVGESAGELNLNLGAA
jgi:hypothetical protein